MELFDPLGRRLYLTAEEREAFVAAANNAGREVRTFCLVLAYTGCRISEALALTPRSFDFSGRAIGFETLKKRRAGVYRAVPMPQNTLDTIDMVHGLQEGGKRKRKARAEIPLWPWSRTTAFRVSTGVPVTVTSSTNPTGQSSPPRTIISAADCAPSAGVPF